jgi:hypothetical protein
MRNVMISCLLLLLWMPNLLSGCAQNNKPAISSSARNWVSKTMDDARPVGVPDFVTLARNVQPVVVNVSATVLDRQQKQQTRLDPTIRWMTFSSTFSARDIPRLRAGSIISVPDL